MGEINNEKVIRIPKKDELLAEFVGILLGDGNIIEHKNKSNKNTYHGVRISGHAENDEYYLKNYVQERIIKLFKVKPGFYYTKTSKVLQLYLNGIRVVNFLKEIGLKTGNKKKNNVGIPKWIFTKEEFMKACLRGLIDTDGCVYMCGNGSKFPRINFCSKIPKLQEDFTKLTKKLGFRITPWNGGKNTMVYRKGDIFKYWDEIGFSNRYHERKFKSMLLWSSPV